MELQKQIRDFLRNYGTTGWILALMVGGLLLQMLIYGLAQVLGDETLYDEILRRLVLPDHIVEFAWQPWSLLTWPLFHYKVDLLGIAVDGLILWAFGLIHQRLLGDIRTRRLLLIAIPIIGLLTVILATLIPFPAESSPFVYGMGPILVLLVASAISFHPDDQIQLFIFGKVKIMWVGFVLIGIELLNTGFSPGGIAVILAALAGYAFILLLKQNTDITEVVWSYYQDNESAPRMKVKYGEKKQQRRKSSGAPQSRKGKIPQDLIDLILDKISEEGYESLSREEKELLFKASKQKGEDGKK